MSARGARSRKAVTKDIEKKEKKQAQKDKVVESVLRPRDAFADWRQTPSLGSSNNSAIAPRASAISSEASRDTSRSISTTQSNGRPRINTVHSRNSGDYRPMQRSMTSASGSASVSEGSATGRDKIKYQKAGKETKAPRGRGGGVPVKRPTATPLPPAFHSDPVEEYTSPNQKTWMNFRIWEGGDSGYPPYAGFEYDEDMQTGNVLVYFKEEQVSEDRPFPQLRCDLEILENAGSTWLSNSLLYGRIEDVDDDWAYEPGSSSAAQSFSPNFPPPPAHRRMLGPTSLNGRSPPPFDIDQPYFGVPTTASASGAQYYSDLDAAFDQGSPPPFQQSQEIQPTHELWFTAPAHCQTPQAQRLHHVAIRNFLAMLHDKPIVGADLFDMLNTLQPEIQVMYDLDSDDTSRSARERSVQMIINHLRQHKLDDVRSSIKTALGILAWSEQDNVRWREGYIESFVHLAGVIMPEVEELADYKRLSIITRRNLGIAAKSLQLRVMETEEKLSTFDFADLWSANIKAPTSPVYQSYSAFRQFLCNHYTHIYGNWPPLQNRTWLTRKVVLALQDDFGALYDYLVNRDVVWDSREERPGKKWEMLNKTSDDFQADNSDLSLTDMLVTFDNRHAYQHIPHPYPLLPREVQGVKTTQKRGLFGGLKKNKTDTTMDAKAHLQLSIVFSDATNLEKTDVSFNGTTLIDKFERFELAAETKNVTPREARLGRWILLYGILQVLSTLSVDVRDLQYTDNVRYFLCPELKRCPDWAVGGQIEYLEATQLRSHCWQRPWHRTILAGDPIELDGNSIPVGRERLERQPGTPGLTPSPLDSPRPGTAERTRHDSPRQQQQEPQRPNGTHRQNDIQRNVNTQRLDNDIRRIGEKIEHLSVQTHNQYTHNQYSPKHRDYSPHHTSPLSPTHRYETEKMRQEEFATSKRFDPRVHDGGDGYQYMSPNDVGYPRRDQYQQYQPQQQLHPLSPRSPMRGFGRGPRSPASPPIMSPREGAGFGARGRELYYNEEKGGWV